MWVGFSSKAAESLLKQVNVYESFVVQRCNFKKIVMFLWYKFSVYLLNKCFFVVSIATLCLAINS